MFIFFKHLTIENNENDFSILLENHDISKLDINRITRYLDKHAIDSKSKISGLDNCDIINDDTTAIDNNIEE